MPDEGSPVRHLPQACGVYVFRDSAMDVLYVGKAKNLAKRVASYFNPKKTDLKNQQLAPLVRKIDYIHCASEREALIWERRLIREHQPFFNAMWKDDKSYPYVNISMGEDFPRMRVVRKKRRGQGRYFGPYPKVSMVRGLLRTLWKRKLFPLRPCRYDFSLKNPLAERKIKSCLYYHTGECPAPCAKRVSRKAYRHIAENAALFFSGKFASLKRRFERSMRAAAKTLDYEQAARMRDHLQAIDHMGERVRCREVRPGKVDERIDRSRAVTDLQQALRLPRPPHHIECFDISHLQGRSAAGSMICFLGAAPNKNHYRRFRIKTVSGIDDFASIAEVVSRRYKRLKSEKAALPDLVLVDGGKGQLSAARKALKTAKAEIPLAALAKRKEEVFVSGSRRSIRLERRRPALRLLQRLRDEAHRFAIAYNRLLRKKELLNEETSR